ncbi:hypothetical protein TNCT_271882 [Trichonephila clavata]|uniref:Uncharacterized protein n=1 Tax=Trichonephila clavata TaxID=2740835 RepID=A0A8X6G4B5_TRICU|nr:hypothetical protein TNCT_271882 [Trichonephila clavata]
MDEEEDEITAFKILLELADSMFWLAVVLDAMFTFYNKIPLYIPVLFIIIQLFIRFQITENWVWRFEASLGASFAFCQLCANASSIFPIEVDTLTELWFSTEGNLHFICMSLVWLCRYFWEDDF